jgi:hypothetical protein
LKVTVCVLWCDHEDFHWLLPESESEDSLYFPEPSPFPSLVIV